MALSPLNSILIFCDQKGGFHGKKVRFFQKYRDFTRVVGGERMANRRKRRSRGLFGQVILTLIFFALIIYSITWLDQMNVETVEGRMRAVDGDSLVMGEKRMRLQGIDAPELSQSCTRNGQQWACGRASRTALRKLISAGGRDVKCSTQGRDQYDRLLVVCRAGETEINAAMVRQGWAVDYGGYGREEAAAQRDAVGIWQGTFEPPVEWRRANRGEASGGSASLIKRLSSWVSGRAIHGEPLK